MRSKHSITHQKLTALEAFNAMKAYLTEVFGSLEMMPVAVVLGELDWSIWTPSTPIDGAVLPDWKKAVYSAVENSENNRNVSTEQAYRVACYLILSFSNGSEKYDFPTMKALSEPSQVDNV